MVFGWGKKKSEKQEPEMAPQKKQILLSDVPNVVDEIHSIRTKTIIVEAETFKNKIKPRCETILHIAIDLERDTLNVDDIDIHLKRLVERGKTIRISLRSTRKTSKKNHVFLFCWLKKRVSLRNAC